MLTFSLQSGSNGNSIYVEAGGARLLFDAGLSGKLAMQRMEARGRDICRVDALIISHDHGDHVRCAGIFHRKFGLPIYMTEKSYKATRCDLGQINDLRHFEAGERLQFGDVIVHSIPTPHDAADGVAFIVEHDGQRLGIFTDLGHPFPDFVHYFPTVDACYLESNYDPVMLTTGPYPYELQERIRGDAGHLSNHEAADLLRTVGSRLRWAAIAQLSKRNNVPDLAIRARRQYVGESLPLFLAPRYEAGPVMVL